MEEELALRLVLLSYFALFVIVRAYYRTKTGTLNEKPSSLEALFPAARVAMRVPYSIAIALWFVTPGLLWWSSLDVPAWFRWEGALFMFASLPLLVWVHQTLGQNFSSTLKVKEEQTLVTHGPYRWVRHPMYAAVFLSVIGMCMITSDWLVLLFSLPMMTPAIARRMTREEGMLLDRFGEDYRRYMSRTGRLLPKFI